MIKQLPEVDRKIFDNPHYNAAIIMSLKEAFRQNVASVVDDFKLLPRPWDVVLEEIQCPVSVWLGGQDQQAPKEHAEIYVSKISKTSFQFLQEEGHLSILYNYGDDILKSAL